MKMTTKTSTTFCSPMPARGEGGVESGMEGDGDGCQNGGMGVGLVVKTMG